MVLPTFSNKHRAWSGSRLETMTVVLPIDCGAVGVVVADSGGSYGDLQREWGRKRGAFQEGGRQAHGGSLSGTKEGSKCFASHWEQCPQDCNGIQRSKRISPKNANRFRAKMATSNQWTEKMKKWTSNQMDVL
jgi:hypothetical protein